LCGYEGKHAHQVYDRNTLYFSNQALVEEKDGVLELAQVEANRSRGSKVYLTSIGLYIFVSKLELTKLSEDRQKFILAAVNYMAECRFVLMMFWASGIIGDFFSKNIGNNS
jgi:hypothetical protein